MYKLLIKLKGKKKNIQGEKLKNDFLNSLTLKDNFSSLIVVKLENGTLELIIRDKIFLSNIIDGITRLKLENKKLLILNLEFDIQEIKLEKLKRILENKKVTIEFLTPTFFKVGSRFKCEYSNYLFFSWLLRKFNKTVELEEKIAISRDMIEKIILVDERLEEVEINLKEFTTQAFKGEIELDFKELDSNLSEKFEKVLAFGLKNNIGYKNKNGYGKIKINN